MNGKTTAQELGEIVASVIDDTRFLDPSLLLLAGKRLRRAGGWVWRGIVTWHKPGSRPMTGRFTLDCEYVVWGSSGQLPAHRHVHPSSFVSLSPPREREHVAQKPEGVARHLLQLVPVGGVVLDPFTGTRSTLGAAKSEGFQCIGIEIEERYCEIARKRCAQDVLDLGDTS